MGHHAIAFPTQRRDQLASPPPHPAVHEKAPWSERYQQHFHDRNGAFEQARHVFLEGSRTSTALTPRVLEIGFGLGLNFRITLADCARRGVQLEYLAYEHDPQPRQMLEATYTKMLDARNANWRRVLAAWNGAPATVDLEGAMLELRIADASAARLPDNWATAIYLDGFSPAVNQELWSEAFIAQLAAALAPGGWMATYCSAGDVRRAMKKAGLVVERRAGWGTKWECLAAQKPREVSRCSSD